jgi:hypothetical protein
LPIDGRNSLPLSKRARIEIYLPSGAAYGRLQTVLERELIYSFGGCTVVTGAKGSYLGSDGTRETESINLIYADAPFDTGENFESISRYVDQLKAVALTVTNEESILVVVQELYHST